MQKIVWHLVIKGCEERRGNWWAVMERRLGLGDLFFL
ncbi:hypothetical protein SLEP1_g56342 [Rubroshorea leprosula]|uniref:Uncharacterized protein n=1 Tax=Rubroshorea leprosula TaxID=152421 RepID=A0AAV5MME0_9ROSI|nr:hypothetical protein SLEP1_g56342 [Rubroshorea leprosula]